MFQSALLDFALDVLLDSTSVLESELLLDFGLDVLLDLPSALASELLLDFALVHKHLPPMKSVY